MTPAIVASCTSAQSALAVLFAPWLTEAMTAFDIVTPMRQAMFLANVAAESGSLSRCTESLNYSVQGLLLEFGRHRISEADARAYGRVDVVINGVKKTTRQADQGAIGNILYGGAFGLKNLGNTQPGDGWRFRGHGLLQTTGRANTRDVTLALRARFPKLGVPDFELNPDLLSTPQWAALSAAFYISKAKANSFADKGDFDGYCDVINIGSKTAKEGDAKDYPKRLAHFKNARLALAA